VGKRRLLYFIAQEPPFVYLVGGNLMFNPKVLVSPLVTDGERVGEVFSVDVSPYDEVTPAAYVVGEGWADWIPLGNLQSVGEEAAVNITAA
jgi:hypothetical protein